MQFITKFLLKEKHKNATKCSKAMLMKGVASVTFHLVTASYTKIATIRYGHGVYFK
jgi:hypothetical protein